MNIETMSDEAIAHALADQTRIVKEGEDAKAIRASIIRRAHHARPETWTQRKLATAAGISQPAVNKILGRRPGDDSLETATSTAYLIGRLLGVGQHIAYKLIGTPRPAKASRMLDKMLEGEWPITPDSVATLQRLIRGDMNRIGSNRNDRRRTGYRQALADINQRLSITSPLELDTRAGIDLWLGHDHQQARLNREAASPGLVEDDG